jgi:adenylate kinase
VTFDILIGRLTGRRSCGKCGAVYHITHNPPKNANVCDRCGSELIQRSDDREEVIRNRLETYDNQTKPLIQFYENQNKLKNIPGNDDINSIFGSIVIVLDNLK